MSKTRQSKGEFMTIMDFIAWVFCVILLAGIFGEYVFIILPATIGGMFLLKHLGRGV